MTPLYNSEIVKMASLFVLFNLMDLMEPLNIISYLAISFSFKVVKGH
jgi:hypothetical protein